MRGAKNSFYKRWHSLTISPTKVRQIWKRPYWVEAGKFHDISCGTCPRFDAAKTACSIVYGSPSRKCAAAAIEANLNNVAKKSTLEIGFGTWALARNLIRRAGGTWTGVDPGQPKESGSSIGKGGYGHAADIPFPDSTFDLVFGIQTFEHWGQRVKAFMRPSRYEDCMQEILRVLKPGGSIYLDAPMHFHGNEMFVMGDVDKLRELFDDSKWDDVEVERWRHKYEPLERFLPSQPELDLWPEEVTSYPKEQIAEIQKNGSAWMATFKARKRNG